MEKQNALKKYKDVSGKTYKQIASDLGVAELYVYQIASNRRTPSRKLAKKINELTGISILDLLYPENMKEEHQ